MARPYYQELGDKYLRQLCDDPVNTATGEAYTTQNWALYKTNAATGAQNGAYTGWGQFFGFISVASPDFVYIAGWKGNVVGLNLTTSRIWESPIDPGVELQSGAVAADGSLVVSSGTPHVSPPQPARAGRLARVLATGQVAWNLGVNAVTPPVIGSRGLVYVGTHEAPGDLSRRGAIEAFDVATGQRVWSAPVPGLPNDLLVGSDGRVYAGVSTQDSASLVSFDQTTGAQTSEVNGIPGAWEIILRSGVIYASGANITAIPVSAAGYDPGSPWPVRQHDNQRTSDRNNTFLNDVCGEVPVTGDADGDGVDDSCDSDNDGNGITDTCEETPDVTPPTISAPEPIEVEATSSSGATGTYTASAIDDVDGPVQVECSPASGSTFPIGTTDVTCKATDSSGNTSVASFPMRVADTTAPVLSGLPATLTAEAAQAGGAVIAYPSSASASDVVDGDVTVTYSVPSGSLFPLGTTLVTAEAKDLRGNTARQTFTVVVRDTTAPQLSVPLDIPATATSPGGAPVAFTTSAVDLVDGAVPVTCSPPSGSAFAPGTTTVTCTATDSHGNSASGSFKVSTTYSWSGILQPINADGSSVFRLGRTVPVKFQLTGASAGIQNVTARLYYRVTGGGVGAVNEASSTAAATTGNLFRYDPAGDLYIFNWGTQGLAAGSYELQIDLGDGVVRTVLIGLR